MVSFRRCILALTVLALFAGLASAQITGGGGSSTGALNCNVTSIPTTLRTEGVTELVGDIQIACSGGVDPRTILGQNVATATIAVNLSAPVTSRLLLSSGAAEVLLLIDEPGSTQVTGPGTLLPQVPVPAGSASAFFAGTTTTGGVEACNGASLSGTACNPVQNVFQGSIFGTQVVFNNVPILAPGTAATRIFRITNVRVNATGLNGNVFGGSTVNANVAITNNVSSVTPATVTVGNANVGLNTATGVYSNATSTSTTASAISSLNFLQCTPVGTSTVPVPGAVLRYVANFNGAFKTRVAPTASNTGLDINAPQNIPGSQPLFSESGFIQPLVTGSGFTAGLADFGTRLRAVFNNIPSGVTVYVSTSNVNFMTNGAPYTLGTGTPTGTIANVTPGNNLPLALLVTSETVPDFNGGVQSPPATVTVGNVALFQVPISNTGAGEVNWELVQGTILGTQSLDFGVYFSYPLPVGTTVGATSQPTVSLSYSPVPSSPTGGTTFPSVTAAVNTPIPRFADTGTPKPILAILQCHTTLLFPYLTNIGGFETGIAIANTSADTLKTPAQSGNCTLTFFSTGITGATTPAPPAFTTPTIQGGAVWANVLTSVAGAGYTGYAFATCNFQFAHGYAQISDTSATNFAAAYLALIVANPNSGAPAGTPIRATANPAEGLEQ